MKSATGVAGWVVDEMAVRASSLSCHVRHEKVVGPATRETGRVPRAHVL